MKKYIFTLLTLSIFFVLTVNSNAATICVNVSGEGHYFSKYKERYQLSSYYNLYEHSPAACGKIDAAFKTQDDHIGKDWKGIYFNADGMGVLKRLRFIGVKDPDNTKASYCYQVVICGNDPSLREYYGKMLARIDIKVFAWSQEEWDINIKVEEIQPGMTFEITPAIEPMYFGGATINDAQ